MLNLKEIQFGQGRHFRAKLGFILLAMEQTVEDDVFKLTPPGVGVHFNRIAMPNQINNQTLASMAPNITECAKQILPEGDLSVLCYTCNSGTMVIGEDNVCRALLAANPKAKATTVMSGIIRGLKAVKAKKIVVATSYIDEVNEHVYRFLTARGFEVLKIKGMGIVNNSEIDLVKPEYIKNFAKSLDQKDAEAVVIICGALCGLEIIADLEKECQKPVIFSNQAMMWDCLRLCNIDENFAKYGQLFALDSKVHEAVCTAFFS